MIEDAPSGFCPNEGQFCAVVPDPALLFLGVGPEPETVYDYYLLCQRCGLEHDPALVMPGDRCDHCGHRIILTPRG